jgi:hypothetical protein
MANRNNGLAGGAMPRGHAISQHTSPEGWLMGCRGRAATQVARVFRLRSGQAGGVAKKLHRACGGFGRHVGPRTGSRACVPTGSNVDRVGPETSCLGCLRSGATGSAMLASSAQWNAGISTPSMAPTRRCLSRLREVLRIAYALCRSRRMCRPPPSVLVSSCRPGQPG